MNRQQRRAAARAQKGSSRPRRFTPAPRVVDPVQHAIAGVTPIPGEQYQTLARQGHGALDAIVHGVGTEAHGARLAAMAEITLALVEQVSAAASKKADATQAAVCRQALTIAQAACDAARQASHRAARNGGRWGLAGLELTVLNECMELHEQFLQMAPQQMVEAAVLRAKSRAISRRVEATKALQEAA